MKGSGGHENDDLPEASENLKDWGESAEKFSLAPFVLGA